MKIDKCDVLDCRPDDKDQDPRDAKLGFVALIQGYRCQPKSGSSSDLLGSPLHMTTFHIGNKYSEIMTDEVAA